MSDCLKGQKLNDYFRVQQVEPTLCPTAIPETDIVKIVAEKVFQECLDVECITHQMPLSDFNCLVGTFSGIVRAEIADFTINTTIVAPGLVNVTKEIIVRVTYLCDGTPQTLDVPVTETRVIPMSQATPGPGNELKTMVDVQFLGFQLNNGILTLFVGVFLVIKFTRLVDLCVNAVLQPTRPVECPASNPCDAYLDPANLDAIWARLQGLDQDP